MKSTRGYEIRTARLLPWLAIGLLLSAPQHGAAQSTMNLDAVPAPRVAPTPAPASEPDLAIPPDVPTETPPLESLMDEFMATSRAIADQPGASEPTEFPGPPGKPNWYQSLRVTRDENPLLERECKEQAVRVSVDALAAHEGVEGEQAALREAAEHMRMHQQFIQNEDISHADYLRAIAECTSFCAPLVAQLIQCHILSVARLEHGIVLFDLGSDVVEPGFRSGLLETVSQKLAAEPERKTVLIGRASRIGDLRLNRTLSARRALAVKDALMASGVAGERIETMWFGWEPPQISVPIASEYGLSDLFETAGLEKINQSVVVVVY